MRWVIYLLVSFSLVAPGAVRADQTDPRLGPWFDLLKTTTGVENLVIQDHIWRAWYAVPTGGDQDGFDAVLALMARGQFAQALDRLDPILLANPEFSEAHNQVAIAYYALDDDAASSAAIFRTLALEPRHFGALAGLAQIRLRGQDPRGAIQAAQAALAINPDMPGMDQLIALARRVLAQESA